MRSILALAALFVLCLCYPATAATIPKCTGDETACVIDGDTFRWDGATIRVENIDAPETSRARCDAERRLGRIATDRLGQLLASGTVSLSVNPADPRNEDRYGRLLRRVSVDGSDLGDVLVAEQLVRPWDGRRHPWCTQ